jgi:glyoxylase-like metal-dependent hydrolase (beta-lactamase superfamily II)
MRATLLTLALCAALGAALAQDTAPSRVADIVTLADGVHWLPGRFEHGRQPDGNSLLLEGRDGIVIVDSGRHDEHTAALIEWARRKGRPIVAVINSHWHLDHLGGNARLRREFPQLVAHASAAVDRALATTMQRSAADLRAMLDDKATDEATRRMVQIDLALLEQRTALAPDRHLDGPPRDTSIGGRALRVGVEAAAVSGGDVWILDRASGTLAVGDFVTLPAPFLDTACTPGWREAMGRIEALPFERLVPGHGPVMSRDDFRRYRGALDKLLACATTERTVPDCAADWIADLGPLLPAASRRAAAGMLTHYFAQHLRAPPEARDRFCKSP